jgi:hypothetical protein
MFTLPPWGDARCIAREHREAEAVGIQEEMAMMKRMMTSQRK